MSWRVVVCTTFVLIALSRTMPVRTIDEGLLSLLVWTSLAVVVTRRGQRLPVAKVHRIVNKRVS
jgi:hypothetical protein